MKLSEKIRIWFENSWFFDKMEHIGNMFIGGFRKGNKIGAGYVKQKGLFKQGGKKLKERLG